MKKVLLRIPEEHALIIEKIAEELKVSVNDVYKFAIFDYVRKDL